MKRTLLLTGLLACASCAAGEEIDTSLLHSNVGSNGVGGQSGASVSQNSGGTYSSNTAGSGGSNGQSGSTGQSGSGGQAGSGSGGAPPSDASTGNGGQGGAAGTSGSGGASGSAGSGGSAVMSDAGFIAGLQVLYANMQTAATSSYIGCQLQAKNGGSSTVAVNELKLRYYFTKDIASAPQFHLNWGFARNAGGQWDMTVTSTVNPVTPAKNNADTYLEFSLSSPNHTNLSPNEWADFSWQVQGVDPSKDKFTQSNDYSWDVGRSSLQQWDHVVLLRNGTVVWGTPP
jgi:hypothetical protein